MAFKNQIITVLATSLMLLASCSSENEPDNRVVTNKEFTAKVENKIWKCTDATETQYVKSNGDTYSSEEIQFAGQMFSYAYFFSGETFTNFSINVYDPDGIYYQRTDYPFILNELTGEVTYTYPYTGKQAPLFTIESISDDALIVRDMYGCLDIGFEPGKFDYTEEELKRDPGSYRRLVLHPLDEAAEKELLEKFIYKN